VHLFAFGRKLASKKPFFLILLLILYTVLVLGTYPIQRFWHSGIEFEQTTTALNHETYGWLPFSSLQNRYSHLPPGYSLLVYAAIKATGWLEAGRLVSFVSLLLTLLIIHDVTRRCYADGEFKPLLSVFFLVTSPLFILLGGSINQETTAVLFASLGIWFYLWGYDTGKTGVGLFLSGTSIALATFAKQSGYFAVIPIAGHLFYQHRTRIFRRWSTYVLVGLPTGTSLAWLYTLRKVRWAENPETNVLWTRSILNIASQVTRMGWSGIFGTIASQFTTQVPGSTAFLAIAALLRFDPRTDLIPLLWGISGLAYYILFLEGSIIHTHYLAVTLPGMSILAAKGLEVVVAQVENRWRVLTKLPIHQIILVLITLVVSATIAYSSLYFYDAHYRNASQLAEFAEQRVESGETVLVIGSELFFFLQPPPGQMEYVEYSSSIARDLNSDPRWDYVVQGHPSNPICNQEWTYYSVEARFSNYCLLDRKHIPLP